MINTQTPCPCQSNLTYHACCQPYHANSLNAPTPEALMRSRYSAFVLELFPYLITTHDPNTRGALSIDELSAPPTPKWLGLDIIDSQLTDNSGTVTFKAWYKHQGKLDAIFERSIFTKYGEQWFYTSGEQFSASLPNRNDPCVCKSGKKFKHCCLKN